MKKNFIIPLVIYPFDVMVSIGESWDGFARHVIKKWPKGILEDFKKRETPTTQGITCVFTNEDCMCAIIKIQFFNRNNPDHAGIMAHEIFHAAEFVLRVCGFKLNSNSHEAYAYLVSYLTEEVYKRI